MYAEVGHIRYEEEEDRWVWHQERVRRATTRTRIRDDRDTLPDYEVVITGKAIRLELAEFCVLRCLARRPYHAFRPKEIVEEANQTEGVGLSEENLRETIVALKSKLGFFRDYVQSVPHLGFRFKP